MWAVSGEKPGVTVLSCLYWAERHFFPSGIRHFSGVGVVGGVLAHMLGVRNISQLPEKLIHLYKWKQEVSHQARSLYTTTPLPFQL